MGIHLEHVVVMIVLIARAHAKRGQVRLGTMRQKEQGHRHEQLRKA